MERVVEALDPEEHHFGHALGQAVVVPGERENEVAGLSDVDVVLGDVVEEDEGFTASK